MAGEDIYLDKIELTAEDHGAAAVFEDLAKAVTDANKRVEQAKPAVQDVANRFKEASTHTAKLGGAFGYLKQHALGLAVGVTGVGFGLSSIIRGAVDGNKELNSLTKAIAGVQFGFQNWAASMTPLERMKVSMGEAREVVEKLEDAETRLAIPMMELGNVYKTVAGPAFQKLGLNQSQVLQLTERAAEASKVFGVSGEMAASTISRALLTKTVRGMDSFSQKLKISLGDMRKMSAPEIYAKINNELKKLGPAAEFMSKGMSGSLFRIKDFFQDTLRDVGTPLFKHIGTLIGDWQKKLEGTGKTMKQVASEWGEKIVSVFGKIEKIASLIGKAIEFAAAHWKELAVGFAASKLPGLLGGMSGEGGIFSVMKSLNKSGGGEGIIGNVGSQFKTLGANLGPVIGALGTFYAGLQLAAAWLDDKQGKDIKLAGEADGLKLAFERLSKSTDWKGDASATRLAESIGGGKDRASMIERLQKLTEPEREILGKGIGAEKVSTSAYTGYGQSIPTLTFTAASLADAFLSRTAASAPRMFSMMPWTMPGNVAKPGDHTKPVKPAANFTGDIYITQDFKDQDPDRVWIGFKNSMERTAENRAQSNLAGAFET